MKPLLPTRKTNRLKNFDYSQSGTYFITICTNDMKCVLSTIVGATCGRPPIVVLTEYGKAVEKEIIHLDAVYECLRVEKYVIMPNHLHLLLTIRHSDGRPQVAPTISRAINQFKGAVSKRIGVSIWQKGFHDHIIRDERDYQARWQYIEENPKKWLIGKDEYYT